MKMKKRYFAIFLAMAILVTGMNAFAADVDSMGDVFVQNEVQPRAGCSNYVLYSYGYERCTAVNCPYGYTKRMRQDLWRQTCVEPNGSVYYNHDYRDVFIACNCY